MEGFAEIRKQPRAVACRNDKSQFYYCMTKAFIHRQMVAKRFVSAELLLGTAENPERRLWPISGIVDRSRPLC